MIPLADKIRAVTRFAQTASYPEAGKNAPSEVKEAVERLKNSEEAYETPLLYLILGSGTPPYKMSKEDSSYTDKSGSEEQTCGNCQFAYTKSYTLMEGQEPFHICSKIRGEIKLPGWCRHWMKGVALE